jgi:hypothetical protein
MRHIHHVARLNRVPVLLLLVIAFAISSEVHAESPAERAAKAGALSEMHGHRVLRLYGNDVTERGYAQGYLLASELIMELESAIQSLPGVTVEQYNDHFIPWSKANFKWDADAEAEMDGVYAGMIARIGIDGMKSKVVGRTMTRDDVSGVNALADYFGPACSAFAAWGERSVDGHVIHGRTLDFPIGTEAVAAQILIVNDAVADRGPDRPARKAFVAVGWPGMITQYTGMNADGLVACIHDGYNVRGKTWHGHGKSGSGFLARGLLLRRILEMADTNSGDPTVSAAKLSASAPTSCGNLFHLSWPSAAAKKAGVQPSAVLEFDATDKDVLVRRPENPDYIVLTNHFCVLSKATECERCAHISEGLDLLEKAKRPIGLSEARKLLKSAEQPVAAHSVYFLPDTLEMYVALSKHNVMSPSVAPTKFTFAELFAKP